MWFSLPDFDPVAVPELALYVWGILFSLFARAWYPEWKRAGNKQNDHEPT